MTISRFDIFDEFIKIEADGRHDAHKDHASSRPLSLDYEFIGLSGETAFGRVCGQMPDLDRKLEGDKGVDFYVPLIFSVDVKTARKAFHLIHEQGKHFADIYVLAQYDDETKQSKLIGWEWGIKLKNAPVKDFGYGIMNHYIPAKELKPIDDMIKRMIRYGQYASI